VYEQKEKLLGPEHMREFERIILLQVIDTQWKDHLLGMDYLKEGIGLRGYGQRDPLVEYKKESFDMFQAMLDRIEEDTVRYLYLIQPVAERTAEMEMPQRRQRPMYYQQPQSQAQPSGQKLRQVRSMIPSKRKKK
jgi:preprotein translocase subunit SecA